MYIAIQLLIAILTSTPTADAVRDLCDVVHRDTGVPTICTPHGRGAPVYDANVCCAGGTCFAASGGVCHAGELLYYCGLGERSVTGEVRCYFEVPSYCDLHPCPTSVSTPPLEIPICCNAGICWAHQTGANDCEIDDLYWCADGVSNSDGTITCVEDEE